MEIRTIFDACRFSSEKMQKINLFATNELFFDVYCLEPGQQQKVHSHAESSKVYVVLEGDGRFHIDGETQSVRPGQAVMAAAGQPHGVENETQDRLVILVGMAPPPTHA